jgi:murein DD-endopeptidase MepM/ murein hydrolase activator NlpD
VSVAAFRKGSAEQLVWPLQGSITSEFGPRGGHRLGGRLHTGLDIAAPTGTRIVSATAGRVASAGWDESGYGQLVVIRAGDGREFYYGHNSRLLVKAGEAVAQGQPIALVGSTGASTGPHLHFEVRAGGRAVDPLAALPSSRVQLARYRGR